jgi:hypothetical protein
VHWGDSMIEDMRSIAAGSQGGHPCQQQLPKLLRAAAPSCWHTFVIGGTSAVPHTHWHPNTPVPLNTVTLPGTLAPKHTTKPGLTPTAKQRAILLRRCHSPILKHTGQTAEAFANVWRTFSVGMPL